mgnify:CR=1 FL=1
MALPFFNTNEPSKEAGFVLVDIGDKTLKIVAWNKDEDGMMRVVLAEDFEIDLLRREGIEVKFYDEEKRVLIA